MKLLLSICTFLSLVMSACTATPQTVAPAPQAQALPAAATPMPVISIDEAHNQLGAEQMPAENYAIGPTDTLVLNKAAYSFDLGSTSKARPLAPKSVTLIADGAEFAAEWPANSDRCELSAKTLRATASKSVFIGFRRGASISIVVDHEEQMDVGSMVVPAWAATVLVK